MPTIRDIRENYLMYVSPLRKVGILELCLTVLMIFLSVVARQGESILLKAIWKICSLCSNFLAL